jgi:hypothetical protein
VRRILVVFRDDDRPDIELPGEVGAILGRPLTLAGHIETELALRVAGWYDVECGETAPTETGVGCLRYGSGKDIKVAPFRWARQEVNHG